MSGYTKFAGTKPLDQIKAQCKARGIEFDDERWRQRGDDHVTLRSPGVCIIFNTFNGRFFGHTPYGEFSSDDKLDGTPWFDALLRFFYIEKPAKCAPFANPVFLPDDLAKTGDGTRNEDTK